MKETGHFAIREITKIEGHANLDVEMDSGKVKKCELQIYEGQRFFESMLSGRDSRYLPKYHNAPRWLRGRSCAFFSQPEEFFGDSRYFAAKICFDLVPVSLEMQHGHWVIFRIKEIDKAFQNMMIVVRDSRVLIGQTSQTTFITAISRIVSIETLPYSSILSFGTKKGYAIKLTFASRYSP